MSVIIDIKETKAEKIKIESCSQCPHIVFDDTKNFLYCNELKKFFYNTNFKYIIKNSFPMFCPFDQVKIILKKDDISLEEFKILFNDANIRNLILKRIFISSNLIYTTEILNEIFKLNYKKVFISLKKYFKENRA